MAKENKELEVKFSGPMPMLSALPESAFLRALIPAGGRWERIGSVYFDTADGVLAAAGLSLRQREASDGTVQTIKSTASPGITARREWVCDLGDTAGFPTPVGEAKIDRLLEEATLRLRAVSEISIDRWRAEFNFKTSALEISIDIGTASAALNAERPVDGPIGEVALKLISGDPADLFVAAQLTLENAPLRLHMLSKRDAAALIASGRCFAVPDVTPFSASASDNADAILQRALITAAERLIRLQTSILDARAPQGVRRMRVELRRFRAVERVYRRAAKCPQLQHLAQKAGIIARALGPARDWDVFLDHTLPAIAENRYAIDGLARLKAAAHTHRALAWADASAQIADPVFSEFVLDLLATAHLQPWRAKQLSVPAQIFGARVLDRARRKTCKVARGTDPADPTSFHALRLALKKLRYGVQLFRRIYPKATRKPYMAAMAEMQDASGVLNDAIVAQKLANKAAMGKGPEAMRAAGFICGYYAARAEAAAKEIDGAWAMFEKIKPFWRN